MRCDSFSFNNGTLGGLSQNPPKDSPKGSGDTAESQLPGLTRMPPKESPKGSGDTAESQLPGLT
jgi:hypothetical protein